MTKPAILQDQIDYYRARAGEYDEWWFRTGRYDRGAEFNAQWHAETAAVEAAFGSWLAAKRPRGSLELACGTGLFTRLIAPRVARLTAVDASPEVIAINRARVGADNVDYVQADLFAWRPTQRYDAVFLSFWLSHVPDERFGAFWKMVRRGARARRRRLSDRLGVRSDVDCEGPRASRTRGGHRHAQAQRRPRVPHRQAVLRAGQCLLRSWSRWVGAPSCRRRRATSSMAK